MPHCSVGGEIRAGSGNEMQVHRLCDDAPFCISLYLSHSSYFPISVSSLSWFVPVHVCVYVDFKNTAGRH